ncbi:hypothetical protein [Haloprofundus salinisoli]|uniref:hypothetical protein n=1 Tax=Haloprofundus salinisoli TaxID=2876193 RepID=UPI001CCC2B3E|nr:hypothetical protein [Haloprofundus salinisoli]
MFRRQFSRGVVSVTAGTVLAGCVDATGTYRIDAETESAPEQWEWFVSNKSRNGLLRITEGGELTFSEVPQL